MVCYRVCRAFSALVRVRMSPSRRSQAKASRTALAASPAPPQCQNMHDCTLLTPSSTLWILSVPSSRPPVPRCRVSPFYPHAGFPLTLTNLHISTWISTLAFLWNAIVLGRSYCEGMAAEASAEGVSLRLSDERSQRREKSTHPHLGNDLAFEAKLLGFALDELPC